MIEVEVGIVVVAIDSVLLDRTDDIFSIPIRKLDDKYGTTQGIAAELLQEYTGIHAIVNNVGWVPMFQRPLIDNPERIIRHTYRPIFVPYIVFLQQIVKPLKGEWLKLIDISQHVFYSDHKDIVNKIISEG